MKKPTRKQSWAVQLTALVAASAAFVSTGQAQVTLTQVTNGLVSWYPLDFVITNGTTLTTPDFLGGRDMVLVNMTANNVISSTRPSQNSTSVSNCLNFDQQGGAGTTIIYYDSKGMSPLDGSGDFLPFSEQINATMNFWIKSTANTNVSTYTDKRFFGECDDGSPAGTSPLWLMGTDSGGGLVANQQAHFLLRQNTGTVAGQPLNLPDGTKQLPDFGYYWTQGANFTSTNNPVLDGNWHMLTLEIESNRVLDIFIDGVRDPGPGGITDANGNPGYGPDVPLTNFWYTTNIYASAGVSNPPPNGYVRWVWNGIFLKGATAFGGFRRQGGNSGGFPMVIDDIGFWNRLLDTNELAFVKTNGIYGIPLVRPLVLNYFTADFNEVSKGDTVTLRWSCVGANTTSGGIVISGVGDVSKYGLIGSTNVSISGDQTFTLTIHNGVAPDQTASQTVKAFSGVDSAWHLLERYDGLYTDTINDPIGGLTSNNWVSAGGDYNGSFDKWNVFTLNTGGSQNKVMTPRTGYFASSSTVSGFESRGALSTENIGSLAMTPGQSNTLFFRFSLQEGPTYDPTVHSDLDFGIGISDYNFLGASSGLGTPYGGTGGGIGPYMSIQRNSGGNFNGAPFDIYASDTADAADGNPGGSYSYLTAVDPNGLQTNVNYYVWMDIVDRNTHSVTNVGTSTNTVDQALYSVWLMKQGDPGRTLLITNFHGNRNYVGYNTVNDQPSPILNKVFLNIGLESLASVQAGAYITTNMIAIDDLYLSKNGLASSIPRLLDLKSIVVGSGSATITWDSLGSLFQVNTYTVQRTLSLSPASWTTLATGLPSGGATTTYTDNTLGSSTTAYYRILWP